MKNEFLDLARRLSTKELLRFAEIRLVALDLDGTVVASGSDSVLEKIQQQVRMLTRKGVRIVVATGRTLSKARSILIQLSFDKASPIVLFNGAVVTNIEGVDVSVRYLPTDAMNSLIAFALENKAVLLLYRFTPRPILDTHTSEQVIGIGPVEEQFPCDFNGLNIEWFDCNYENIPRCCTALIVGCEKAPQLTHLRGVSLTSSGAGYLEVRPEGIDKGAVLQTIAHRYNVRRRNVLAIGDNDNDCEMLTWAGLSIVPLNASRRAKGAASIVSQYNDHHCVIEALRLILDARRFCDGLQRVPE